MAELLSWDNGPSHSDGFLLYISLHSAALKSWILPYPRYYCCFFITGFPLKPGWSHSYRLPQAQLLPPLPSALLSGLMIKKGPTVLSVLSILFTRKAVATSLEQTPLGSLSGLAWRPCLLRQHFSIQCQADLTQQHQPDGLHAHGNRLLLIGFEGLLALPEALIIF